MKDINKHTRLAGIQFCCSNDKTENLDKAIYLSELAIEKDANIICFQQLMTHSWFPKSSDEENFKLAESIDGETVARFSSLAKEHHVIIVCTLFEKNSSNDYYNTAVVIGTDGNIIGLYRKVHIPFFSLWEEKYYFKKGDLGFPVFQTEFGNIGIQLCWDNFFPEVSRILALKGAEIIISPTAAAFDSHSSWERVITSNAITNGLYIIRINRCGSEDKLDFYGKSFCVSPVGNIMSDPTGLNDGIYFTNIDLKLIGQIRQNYPFLKERNIESYSEILTNFNQ